MTYSKSIKSNGSNMRVLCRSAYDVFNVMSKVIPSFSLEETLKAPKFCWYDSKEQEYFRPKSYRHFAAMLSEKYPEAQINWQNCKQIGRYFYVVFNTVHDLADDIKEVVSEIKEDIVDIIDDSKEIIEDAKDFIEEQIDTKEEVEDEIESFVVQDEEIDKEIKTEIEDACEEEESSVNQEEQESATEELPAPDFKAMKGPRWSKEAIIEEAAKYSIILEDEKKQDMLAKFEADYLANNNK